MLVFALKTPLQNLMWAQARPDSAMSDFGHSFHCARSVDKIQQDGGGGGGVKVMLQGRES